MDNGSKKDIMFERMREKKKEVKIVRRIVLVIRTCSIAYWPNWWSLCL